MSGTIEWLNDCGEAWMPIVLHGAWQSAAVGLFVLLIVRAGKRVSSPVLYGLLLLALVKFLVPPLADAPFGLFSQIEADSAESARRMLLDEIEQVKFDRSAIDGEGLSDEPTFRGGSTNRGESTVGINTLVAEAIAERTQPQPQFENQSVSGSDSNSDAHSDNARNANGKVSISSSQSGVTIGDVKPVTWLMLVHVLGSILVLAGVLLRVRRLRTLLRSATQAGSSEETAHELSRTLGLRRFPRVAVSSLPRIPFSTGVLQPAVVIPRHLMDELDDEQLSVVLLHELAHHRRRDPSVIWLQVLVSALWWFHPVLWLINRRLQSVREDCCDDLLLSRKLVNNGVYCETLLKVASTLSDSRSLVPSLTASMSGGRHPLASRLRRIMDDRIPRPEHWGIPGLIMFMVAATLVLPGLSESTDVRSNAYGQNSEVVPPVGETGDTANGQQTSSSAVHEVTGRLSREDGSPISDAFVLVTIEEIWSNRPEGSPVVARTKSDVEGRFLAKVTARSLSKFTINKNTGISVWIHSPDSAVERRVSRGVMPENIGNITLERAPTASFLIRSADSKSLAGIKVTPASGRFDGSWETIPIEIRKRMTTTLAADGKLRIKGIGPDQVVAIDFESAGIGRQQFADYRQDEGPSRVIQLRSTGSIQGQLVLPRGVKVDLSGVKVRLATLTDERHGDHPRIYGIRTVYPDKAGRFRIPAIAEGSIRSFITEPDELSFRSDPPRGLMVVSGETTQLKIPMHKAALTTGSVRERSSKRPVSNVRFHFQYNFQTHDVRTGSDGKFHIRLLPETQYHAVFDLPGDYLPQNIEVFNRTRIPRGADRFTLNPVEVMRGRTVEGTLVDSEGKPIRGAQVAADWDDPDEKFGESALYAVVDARQWAMTNDSGRFRLDRLHPKQELTLTPVRSGIRLGASVKIAVDQRQPVKLVAKDFDFVSLSGRLVDPDGIAVPKAAAWIFVCPVEPGPGAPQHISARLKSDINGRFTTKKQLPRNYAYRVSVRHENKEIATSRWFRPSIENTTVLPTVTVKQPPATDKPQGSSATELPSMTRTIVDSDGRPVEDALVISWVMGNRRRQWTKAGGNVTLRRVPETGVYMFVQAAGFRFHGEFSSPDSERQTITLRRIADPPARRLKTRNDAGPDVAIIELARKGFAEFFEAAMEHNATNMEQIRLAQGHRAFATLDPEAALKFIGNERLSYQQVNLRGSELSYSDYSANVVRREASIAQSKHNLDAALQTLQNINSDDFRFRTLITIAETQSPAKRRELFERAGGILRALDGTRLVESQTWLASRYLKHGDMKTANRLFGEAFALAEDLPNVERAGFSRGYLAWHSAPVDFRKSVALLDQISKDDDRYRSNIAHQIADIDPELAEKLLNQVKHASKREQKTVRVCYRMSKVDPQRARRIADTIREIPSLRAFALGAIATGNPNSDIAACRKLLDEAFGILQTEVDHEGRGGSNFLPLVVAVGLLPMIEESSPDLLDDYFWRTLSLRTDHSIGNRIRTLGRHGPNDAMRMADPVLAACLFRYDASVAWQLTIMSGDETLNPGPRDAPHFLFGALAMLDPETAVRAAMKLPDTTDREVKAKYRAWDQVISMLDKSAHERWQYLMDRELDLWQPGKVDL